MSIISQLFWSIVILISVNVCSAFVLWNLMSSMEIHTIIKVIVTILVLLFAFHVYGFTLYVIWAILRFLGETLLAILCCFVEMVIGFLENISEWIKRIRYLSRH